MSFGRAVVVLGLLTAAPALGQSMLGQSRPGGQFAPGQGGQFAPGQTPAVQTPRGLTPLGPLQTPPPSAQVPTESGASQLVPPPMPFQSEQLPVLTPPPGGVPAPQTPTVQTPTSPLPAPGAATLLAPAPAPEPAAPDGATPPAAPLAPPPGNGPPAVPLPDTTAPAPAPAAPTPPLSSTPVPIASDWQPRNSVVLQALDKVTARSTVLTGRVGDTLHYGALSIAVKACVGRPPDEPQDSAAYFDITDAHAAAPDFHGWLLANEPEVSVFQHPGYDIRLTACRP